MNPCKICSRLSLHPLNDNICGNCRSLCYDVLVGHCNHCTIVNICILCKKIKNIEEGRVLTRYRNAFICDFCYTKYHYIIFGYDNTCMICLESNLENTPEHIELYHELKLSSHDCKYCDKIVIIGYDYKHHCNIPIKNKYMNVNVL